MSKISPVQAEALGLKVTKPAEAKPAPAQAVSVKPAPPKVITKKPAAKKPVAKKPIVKKPVVKTPAITKLVATKSVATKVVVKPVAKIATTKSKPVAKAKSAPKAKSHKVKMERDSFTMPKEEYAQLTLLKARMNALGQPAKKSELLRAGIKLLVAMSDNTLKMTLAKVPVIKTGRPKKK